MIKKAIQYIFDAINYQWTSLWYFNLIYRWYEILDCAVDARANTVDAYYLIFLGTVAKSPVHRCCSAQWRWCVKEVARLSADSALGIPQQAEWDHNVLEHTKGLLSLWLTERTKSMLMSLIISERGSGSPCWRAYWLPSEELEEKEADHGKKTVYLTYHLTLCHILRRMRDIKAMSSLIKLLFKKCLFLKRNNWYLFYCIDQLYM